LAIEFAAARAKVLSVDQLTARLDDRFRLLAGDTSNTIPRHQTLRATMDWSYNLLSMSERTVLRRLSVFAGGWTLEASEAVCSGDSIGAADVLELLTRLIDKSLVAADVLSGEARYRLLETVRQYARDLLQKSDEISDARGRHRDWYLALAQQAAPELWGPRQAIWLARLEAEHDNLRAALAWSLAEKDGAEPGLRLVGALHYFWIRHGHLWEGRGWTERALARRAEVSPTTLLNVLHAAANLALKQGDYTYSWMLAEQGLQRSRELGRAETSAWFLFRLAQVASKREEYERAAALLEQSLSLSNDRSLKSLVPGVFARQAWRHGDYERAMALLTAGLDLLKQIGDPWHVAVTYNELGWVAWLQDDLTRALAFYSRSLQLCRTLGDRWITEECLYGLAFVACARREYERAARLFAISEATHEVLQGERTAVFQGMVDRDIARAQSALGETAFASVWAEARAMTTEQAFQYALAGETRRLVPRAQPVARRIR